MFTAEFIFFGAFALFIASMLAIDLGVFNKKAHVIKVKEAAIMSLIWVSFALLFYVLLAHFGEIIHGIKNEAQLQAISSLYKHPNVIVANDFNSSLSLYRSNLALEFITGYLIEYALSVDNIFVIVLIFSAFNVQEKHYHRVLFWGILGAIVLRFIFIFLGATLIQNFDWIVYLFAVFLIYAGLGMFLKRNEEDHIDTENHIAVKFAAKFFRVYPKYVNNHFMIKRNKLWYITPLFIVLIVIEFSDLIFAVDSIPAIFSVTKDPYIVFFSNIFAILGLRSMFFLLVNSMQQFHYLKIGLSILLIFIGFKMLAHVWLTNIGFGTIQSLITILVILGFSVLLSLVFPNKKQ